MDILATEEVSNLAELPLSTEQGCGLPGEVVGVALKRFESREIGGQVRMNKLEDPLRVKQVAQPVLTQVAQFGVLREGRRG